jgi:fucose permease
MKTKFWREVIVAVGILPGLWLYVGVDPEAQANYVLLDVIVKQISTMFKISGADVSSAANLFYGAFGAVSAIATWFGVYCVGGGWGVLAVLAGFVGALFLGDPFGIWLIIGSLAVAPFLPVDPEYSLDN